MEDILEMAVQRARSLGASYAEARYQSDIKESILLKNGTPEATSVETMRGIAIRAIMNGGLGFGSTNVLGRRSVNALVDRVVKGAGAAGSVRKSPIVMSPAQTTKADHIIRPRIPAENVPLESRLEMLKEADSYALEAAERSDIKLAGRYLSTDALSTERTVINSDGSMVHSIVPRVSVHIFLTATLPGKGAMQRSISHGEVAGWEGAERWDLPASLAKETRTLSRALHTAKTFKGGKMDVVLGPEVVGLIAHESSGHPAEGDRILGREAAQAGETYLGKDSIGLRVGSDLVNVVDDPTLTRTFGHYLYDEEGVKARRRYLIKGGIINEFLHNRETAAEFGAVSNGSSRSVEFDREPIVRMGNTFVEPGDRSFEEMFEGVRSGVYIKNFMEWNIDDRRYNQKYVGLEAYLIESGKISSMVRNPVLEITTPGLWKAVDAIGDEMEFTSAYCGKGDPMQGIPVGTGGPHIRLKGIRMEGAP
ncbi:MAG: TldD/PmbA family protein [Methanomassiliicoccales archaeon]|nr:TldD/PmbA family protein [Methanomassiliicoccales archaeon]